MASVLNRFRGQIGTLLLGAAVIAIAWVGIEWTINRKYVDQGESLLLTYKGPPLPFLPGYTMPTAGGGQFAEVDEDGSPLQKGVLAEMKGPGRHFYSPFWWERQVVADKVVKPGEVGIATSKMGENLPASQFLVDGDLGETNHKGVLRKVFPPGRYRVNEYAYGFDVIKLEEITSGNQKKHTGWVEIEAGYIGVVTNLTDNPETGALPGIQDAVLPPGLYPINPKEQHVDIVEIGFREKSITSRRQLDAQGEPMFDASGEPAIVDDDTGISFPSSDGFGIHMDFTAIWGVMPDQAPEVIRKFGNVAAVEDKVIVPQIESICRNMGSKLGAVDLLVGESRQQFQLDTSESFEKALEEKNLTLSYGLVRYIFIPQEVRLPIQEAFISDELKLTREQEQLTAKTEANLREAEAKVELEKERVRAETEKLVAEAMAEGQKVAEETAAETLKLVAAIDKEIAELEAQATVTLGQAGATTTKLREEARADKFRLAVEAFGSGEAYNQWVFASGLPEDVQLNLLYAGEGTFWTDLKGFTDVMLGKQVSDEQRGGSNPPVQPARNRARANR